VSQGRKDREQEAERRRRLAEAFGDPLPERTSDERPDAWGESSSRQGGAGDEEWLRSQVPPHHG
jgi:hypothetical protein